MAEGVLTNIKGGINRLRTKGGARADVLYDAVNCHENDEGMMVARPGTSREATLDADTVGLASFEGELITFCHEIVSVPSGFRLFVLSHPDSTPEAPIALSKIHFAEPFMRFLYVAAEFENGDIYHFWLQTKGEWEAETFYYDGDVVEPTTPNGLGYKATRYIDPYPSWAPGVPRAVGDKIEPTEYNGFYYEVVDVIGTSPRSGSVEPTWPTEEGATVFEDTEGNQTSDATTTVPPSNEPDQETQERYDP